MHEEWDPPGQVPVDEAAEIVYPYGGGVTNNITGEFDTSKLATIMWRRDFGLVDRHNGRQHTDTEAGDDSAGHHDGHIGGEGLEGTPDEEDARTVQDGLSPAKEVTDAANHQGRDQSPDFENGYHGAHLGLGGLVKIVYEMRAAGGRPSG